jgi:DNA sulfur modification protein DndD
MLQILRLKIKNYRQYKGMNEIELQGSAEKNINIIEGQNGAGKSNILNAITLCFYNQEVHQEATGEELETLPYVTESVLEELNTGESARGHIEVHLGEQTSEFIFRRDFETFKVRNGFNDQTFDLELQRQVGSEYEIVDDPQTTLNQLLPGDVKDYFIFDGEALTEFFEGGYKNRVRDGIVDVSHIGVLNDSISHLDTVSKEIRRKANDVEGEAAKIQKQIEDFEAELEEYQSEKEQLEKEKEQVQAEIDRIDEKLHGATDERIQELVQRRDDLRESIKSLKQQRNEQRAGACEALKKAGPAVYTTDALEYTLDELQKLEEKGRLPPKIQNWFVEELIERGECICGEPIEEGDESHEHLEELKSSMSDVSTENLEGKSELPRIIRDGNQWAEQVRKRRKRISELSAEIEEQDEELGEVKNKLKGAELPDDVDVAELARQQEGLEEDHENYIRKIGQKEARIEEQESKIARKEEEYREELRKEGRHEDILKQVDFASDALGEMRGIKDEILGQIRADTEANMNSYFNDLIWKNDEYDISLDDDYGITVQGPESSDNRIGSLSAGEKQVLALSFMAALSDISGFNAPIVIDTPLGRISSDPKRRIAQNLPDYLENTQLTFLMTDEEYTSEVQGMMRHRVANEYRLQYESGTTEVVPYE